MIQGVTRTEMLAKVIRGNKQLARSLCLRWTKYIPHDPTPKQRAFLLLPQREVFYGGAAGGGKSDALLMGALQYVDVPGYSAIIFRKHLTDADLPNAILARSREWLDGSDAYFKNNTWHFPSGARVAFGFLSDELKKYRYQGAEFQYIAFDELTQFWEDDYRYLFSRLRKPKCPKHEGRVVNGKRSPLPADPHCKSCREFAPLARVPLRMRSAANPGGVGHLWVKKRFDIGPWIVDRTDDGKPVYRENARGKPLYIGRRPRRPFIPALIEDNPFLDYDEYAQSLRDLDPVTREQLLNGDWSISADGRFRKGWCRYYSTNGPYLILGPDRKGQTIPLRDCLVFQIVDPAASAKEGPGDTQNFRGAPSWTVIGTFALTPNGHLLWLDIRRFRKEIPETYQALKKQWKMWKPQWIGIECDGLGIGLFQACQRAGLPVREIRTNSRDKLVRATDACNRMEQGRIWLPQTAPWLEDLEGELFTWTGHPDEQDDQIDVLAHAAMQVSRIAAYQPNEDNVLADMSFDAINDLTPEVF